MFKSKIILFPIIVIYSLMFMSCSDKYLTEKEGEYNITFNDADWYLSFPSKDYKLSKKQNSSAESAYYYFQNTTNGLAASFIIEPAYEYDNAVSYRNDCWNNMKKIFVNAKNIVKTNADDYAMIEYMLPEIKGTKIDFQNMNMYFVKDGYWIDAHLSKAGFKEKDRELFTDFFKSISFKKRPVEKGHVDIKDSITKVTNYFYNKGVGSILAKNNDKAAEYFEKAYQNELIMPTLDKQSWYVLVDELGMLYGSKLETDKCKEVLEYGISKDSTYPIFYYSLACLYAETHNLDKSIKYLKTAFKYKKNILDGEEMPNPREDDSFNLYLNDSKFQDALKEIGM